MTGAAGGLAGGLWAELGAELVPGAPFVLDALGFDERLRTARAVVTGEGRIDEQTLQGKVVGEVATRSRQRGVPCSAIVGRSELDRFGRRLLDLDGVDRGNHAAGDRGRGRGARRPAAAAGAVSAPFPPAHRGGSGPPLVLLHGFMETWRTWELVLPALERRHDVLALTLPGHAGGPPLHGDVADALERALDEAGFATAHLAGNSAGGFLALELAARGRARSVVAFAPAGGWARDDDSWRELLAYQRELLAQAKVSAPHADAVLATPEGRRRATQDLVVRSEHLPTDLLRHLLLGVAACRGGPELIERGLRDGFALDAEGIACPVRIVWGAEDRLLPWPSAAARFRTEWLPHADWVELDGVGHAPQLDVPVEAAELILGWTAR